MEVDFKVLSARYQIPFGNALVREVVLRNCGELPQGTREVGWKRIGNAISRESAFPNAIWERVGLLTSLPSHFLPLSLLTSLPSLLFRRSGLGGGRAPLRPVDAG